MKSILGNILVLLTITNSSSAFGQGFEFYGGINNNILYDYNKNEGHFRSDYNSDFGYTAGLAVDSLRIDWLKIRLTLQFDKYAGKLNVSDGWLGSYNTTIANVEKSVLSFGIFPINLKILNKIDLNFGLSLSALVADSFNGTISGSTMNQPDWSFNLQDKYDRYNSSVYFGFQVRIAYSFNLSESIFISPQYLYYYGFSHEFVESPGSTKAMRHYFCIGLMKKMPF
jgi:hypothetical protein